MSSSNEKAAKKIVQSVEDTRLEFLPENKSALLVSPSLLLVSNPIGVRYIGAESFRSKRRGSAGGGVR
jgi:hypothetical protein